jgi:hypothetical protein
MSPTAISLEWRAVAFVASDKGVLQRVFREKGAVIDSEGLEALGHLPGTFSGRESLLGKLLIWALDW